MTLHEAIETVLRENKRPLTTKAIASLINTQGYYQRNDSQPVEPRQVLARVRNYPSTFEQINDQIILVEDQIWKNLLFNYSYLVNTLRGVHSATDVQFILAVLLFFKRHSDIENQNIDQNHSSWDNVLANQEMLLPDGRELIDALNSFDRRYLSLEGVFKECGRFLSQLDYRRKTEISIAINKIDTRDLDERAFGDAFEYFLSITAKGNVNADFAPTPFSLRELMINVLEPESGRSLFDPVAGTGGLLIQANYYSQGIGMVTSGTEINMRVAQLGNMNLILHGIQDAVIRSGDCFQEVDNSITYDYIVADLPSSGVINSFEHELLFNKYLLAPPRSGRNFGSLVLLILSKLKDTGKAVITVSEGFLMKKGKEKEIRDILIDQDVIESVISLPYGTLRPYTDAKASLLVLNKNKEAEYRNRIRFITANVADHDSKTVYLNNDDIIAAYKSDAIFAKDSQILDISELRQDNNLSAEGYDEQYILANLMIKEGSGKLLSELVSIRGGIQPQKTDIDPTGDFPLIKIENLSRDILETDLSDNISSKVYFTQKYARALISEKCLLVARIGENLKATIFVPNEKNKSILIHTGIYALLPLDKKDSVDLEYLYYQLYSSFVVEQVKKRKLGAVMPYVSIASLKQIVIPYVDRQTQKSFIESQKANLISEEKNRANAVLKSLGSKDELRQSELEIIKTLTHQLRPTFMGINSISSRIMRVIEKEKLQDRMEFNDEDQQIEVDPEIAVFTQKPENFPLGKLVKKLMADSEHLSDILGTVEKVMNFKLSGEDLTEIDLLNLLKEYKNEKKIAINHKYEIIVKGEDAVALINKPAFKELLDQLLQNAEDHGFTDFNSNKKYRVQFIVRHNRNRDVISIEYSNNGAPYELQQKDFITAFDKGRHSKGSGIGGNYINRIVEAHGGQILVVENNTKGFSLIIELPTQQKGTYE
ncbi:N-6 DNA methylase [Pedobacter fastidiosus]|uniref:site-specific DNA-methyltransferase (adenine-specific) n=1 Tax=Pedobacter fastidiosus TaxID=2765361 RepID=A0ABR7KXN2_9SPHI|nr:N-6 DNA methylase [Pedobacter fastidiosus]MBC6112780.1 N-6 DNA methylase [Pedobacter fastidiosus]